MNLLWRDFTAFIGEHWRTAFLIAAPVLMLTQINSCNANASLRSKLAVCEAKPPVIQVQTVTVKERCAGRAEVIPEAGSPCPKVTLTLDGSSETATSQSQTAQATTCPPIPAGALWIGGGYLSTPYASVGLEIGDWQAEIKRSLTEWGGEAKYKVADF